MLKERVTIIILLLFLTIPFIGNSAVPKTIIGEEPKENGICVVYENSGIDTAMKLETETAYTVQALIPSQEKIQELRKTVASKGLSGKVLVTSLSSNVMPYTENFINLLVIKQFDDLEQRGINIKEVVRVIAPFGRGCVETSSPEDAAELKKELESEPVEDITIQDNWVGFTKQYSKDMAEWTHGRCSGDGNVVSNDKLVGLLRHTQWVAGPRFQRSHAMLPSYTVMVSGHGRLFYIADDSVAGYSGLPDKWTITAHDAFNGKILWKLPVPNWGWKAWSYWGEGHASRYNAAIQMVKRMVIEKDKLYFTMGFNAPVSEIDAATGKILRVFENTKYTDEIVYHNGVLYLSVCDEIQKPWPGKGDSPFPTSKPEYKKRVMAVDATTGKTLWKTEPHIGRGVKADRLGAYKRLDVTASDDGIFFMDIKDIYCLNPEDGSVRWKSPRLTPFSEYVFKNKSNNKYAPWKVLQDATKERQNLVSYKGVLLVSEPGKTGATYRALDAKTGKEIWKYEGDTPFKSSYIDMYPIGDKVWVLSSKLHDVVALDLKTGKVVKTFDFKEIEDIQHHHRCYPDKATVNYLIFSQSGAEFMDINTGEVWHHNWQRSGCRFGYVFANGLTYKTPDHCFCYVNARLQGFYAMSSPKEAVGFQESLTKKHSLEKGPAYEQPVTGKEESNAWPTFRADVRRSASSNSKVPVDLSKKWSAKIPGTPTAPVVAEGKLVVCSKKLGQVYAFNAENGNELWKYITDIPIDSPPTIYKGKVIFGCNDGWVYCLNASDGILRWRFRVAPGTRMIESYNHIESVWPVPGSVLVADNKVFCAAGRSSYLDNGITACVLNADTGELIEKTTLADTMKLDYASGRNGANDIPGSLSDILVSDGKSVFMRFTKLDLVTQLNLPRYPDHITVDGGFLDDRIFQKAKWRYAGLDGNNIVFDSKQVYMAPVYSQYTNRGHYIPKGGATDYLGFPQNAKEVPKIGGYTLNAALQPQLTEQLNAIKALPNTPKDGKATTAKKDKKGKKTAGRFSNKPPKAKLLWKQDGTIPVSPWAMALVYEAGKTDSKMILIAGFDDQIDPNDPWATIEGREGGELLLLSAKDGKKIAEYKLSAAPVWNGMAVAYGKVYITSKDGSIICMDGK